MSKPLTPETIVELLNDMACDQTERSQSGVVLEPFEYISTGNGWVIQMFGIYLAGSEDDCGLEPEQLWSKVVTEARKLLVSIALLKPSAPAPTAEFIEATGLTIELAIKAWTDYCGQRDSFADWWASNQGRYV